MKKNLFTFLSATLLSAGVYAQQHCLTISSVTPLSDTLHGNGFRDTCTSSGTINNSSFSVNVYIQNNCASPITVSMEYIVIDSCTGSFNDICGANNCYSADSFPASGYVIIPDNSINNGFFGNYIQPPSPCTSTIAYRFWDVNDPSDADTLFVNYALLPLGINNVQFAETYLSNPFPNPAVTYTNIAYSLSVEGNNQLIIYDMPGREVKEFNLDGRAGTLIVPTADLRSGMYFYTLLSSGISGAAKKLIVSHE